MGYVSCRRHSRFFYFLVKILAPQVGRLLCRTISRAPRENYITHSRAGRALHPISVPYRLYLSNYFPYLIRKSQLRHPISVTMSRVEIQSAMTDFGYPHGRTTIDTKFTATDPEQLAITQLTLCHDDNYVYRFDVYISVILRNIDHFR